MYRVDNATATATLPDSTAPGPNEDGFYTGGDPGNGIPATVVEAEHLNMLQEEIAHVIEDEDAGNMVLDKSDNTQLKQAILALVSSELITVTTNKSHISGLTFLPNSGDYNNDIDIFVGEAISANSDDLLSLAATITKRLDASWAEGNNAGGLFSGSKANNTWYHLHLIRKDADGTIDVGFDTSASAANKPVGWSAYRRIGSVKTDSSGNIIRFLCEELAGGGAHVRFYKPLPTLHNSLWSYNVEQTIQLDTPPGYKVFADIVIQAVSGDAYIYVYSADEYGYVYGESTAVGRFVEAGVSIPDNSARQYWIWTDTARQIKARSIYGSEIPPCYGSVTTYGWQDQRRI